MIRTTVLAVTNYLRQPASTNEVITAVVDRIEDRKVPGIEIIDRHEARLALECLCREGKLVRHVRGGVEPTRIRRSGRRINRAVRGTISWSLPGVVADAPAKRMPCPTCPWRKSVPKRGFPGGIINANGLLRQVRGGAHERIMQCHCTRDDRPEACVGFVLQVGREFDPEQMGTDEELHSLESLLLAHGGRPDDTECAP